MKKNVSIIINTLNRASLLERTLKSLTQLDYHYFEVIVVNGPSTDNTSELLAQWQDRVRIGSCAVANLSMSRNIGIAMARGEFVAFIDDDAIPEPEWLCQAIEAFDNQLVAASGGKVFDREGYEYQFQYSTCNRLGNGNWKLQVPRPEFCYPFAFEFPYLQGTNTIFRKSALLRVGGFDEQYIYYLDETDVCLRLVDAGYIVKQLSKAYVHHKYAPSYIRTNRTAINRFPVIKSKIYFSNRYALSYLNPAEVDKDNELFIQNQRNDVEANIKAGYLNEDDLFQFESQVVRAKVAAMQALKEEPKLISSQLLDKFKFSSFKLFNSNQIPKKLTIILLCEDYPPDLLGGIARFTQDKATALAALGHKVHVIARSHTVNKVDLEDGVWVHRISVKFCQLTPEAMKLNIPQSHWDQSQSFLDEIDRIATHRRIDLIEAPIWNIVGIAPVLSKRYKVVTSLQTTLKLSLPLRPDLTQDEIIYKNFTYPIINAEKYLYEHSDHLLSGSQAILNEIEKAHQIQIPGERVSVVHYGVSEWKKEIAEISKSDVLKILFVGRFEKRKGIDLLLEIIPSLCQEYSHIEFHLVGDYNIPVEKQRTYKDLFSFSNLVKNRVRFYGKITDEELKRHYTNCDIFVAPSRFESFGLIYLEAMMFSKPVIGCLTGGIPEVVVDGETGLLAKADDPISLHLSLKKLIENEELRRILGKNGRSRYEALFTANHMAENCLNVYKKLVSVHEVTDHTQKDEVKMDVPIYPVSG